MAACRVEDDNREVVGYMERNSERAQANARLIAAAPMLLDLLQVIADSAIATPSRQAYKVTPELIEDARAAIRAAKGEQP